MSNCRKERFDIRADSLNDSNGGSILCFFGPNGKKIPANDPLDGVFTDCGRTLVAEGSEFDSFTLPNGSTGTAGTGQIAAGLKLACLQSIERRLLILISAKHSIDSV